MTSLLAFIILIGVLITFHEAGHFIVAKLSGVKVHTFSIGFGQAIYSKQYGETEYRIAWIPLGGYVRLHGMEAEFGDTGSAQNTEGAEDTTKPIASDPDAHRSLQAKPPWIRVLIFAAGPAMNLILPFLLLPPFFALSSNFDQVYGSLMGSIDQGLPAYKAGLRAGDQITHINEEPVETFWQVAEYVEGFTLSDPPLAVRVQRPGVNSPIEVDVHPEQIAQTEPLLGFTVVNNRIGFQPYPLASDVVAHQGGLFAEAGGQNFDRIQAVNGDPLERYFDLIPRLSQLDPQRTITLTVARIAPLDPIWRFLQHERLQTVTLPPLGQWWPQGDALSSIENEAERLSKIETRLGIIQAGSCISSIDPQSAAAEILQVGDCVIGVDGERHTLAAFIHNRIRHQPELPKSLLINREGQTLTRVLNLRHKIHKDPLAGEIDYWQVGFTFAGLSRAQAMGKGELITNQNRWAYGWSKTKQRVSSELTRSLMTLGGMFSGQVSPTQLGGPVTIFYLAGRQAEAGFDQFLYLMVVISLSIALINLVPVPGLDGGHILIASLELIIRRPLPDRVKMSLQASGVVLILALVLFALGNDLLRMWRLSQGG